MGMTLSVHRVCVTVALPLCFRSDSIWDGTWSIYKNLRTLCFVSVQLVQIRPCNCCKYVANGDSLQSPGMLLASLSHCVASGNIAPSTSQGSRLNQEGKVSPTLVWLCTIASPVALSHWKSQGVYKLGVPVALFCVTWN